MKRLQQTASNINPRTPFCSIWGGNRVALEQKRTESCRVMTVRAVRLEIKRRTLSSDGISLIQLLLTVQKHPELCEVRAVTLSSLLYCSQGIGWGLTARYNFCSLWHMDPPALPWFSQSVHTERQDPTGSMCPAALWRWVTFWMHAPLCTVSGWHLTQKSDSPWPTNCHISVRQLWLNTCHQMKKALLCPSHPLESQILFEQTLCMNSKGKEGSFEVLNLSMNSTSGRKAEIVCREDKRRILKIVVQAPNLSRFWGTVLVGI